MVNFLRTSGHNKLKLGYGRNRKDRKWRRARGRHNKIREKRKGRLKKVESGYRTNRELRGQIGGKIPVFVKNMHDLSRVKKNDVVIIATMGRRKRIGIENKIKELGATLLNERREK